MSEETKDAELAAVDANEPLFFNVPDNAAVLVDVLLNAPVTVPPPAKALYAFLLLPTKPRRVNAVIRRF